MIGNQRGSYGGYLGQQTGGGPGSTPGMFDSGCKTVLKDGGDFNKACDGNRWDKPNILNVDFEP